MARYKARYKVLLAITLLRNTRKPMASGGKWNEWGERKGNRVLVKKYWQQQRENNISVQICKAMGKCCNDMNGKKCM